MSRTYNVGETLEVSIEKIVSNGLGLCFSENLTLFVPLAAAGDKLLVEIRQIKRKTAFARIIEVIEASPDRIEPKCSYYGTCGGCDFQHLSYIAQLDSKVEIVRDCLTRIGKINFDNEIPIIPSSNEFGYRLRTQFHANTKKRQIGFYRRQSHDVIDIGSCPILDPAIEAKLIELREKLSWDDFDRESINIETASAGGETSIYSTELIEPTDEIQFSRDGDRYFFNARSFFQGNQFQIENLVNVAIGDAQGRVALDLYCGVGLFSIAIAKHFGRVIGIEANEMSVRFAKKSRDHAGKSNVEFRNERIRDFLDGGDPGNVDFIIIDPPRSGIKRRNLEKIISLGAERISYISCNPSTLARDLRILVDSGYVLQTITAIDLFPQTHHVETVVHLNCG